MNTIPAQRLPLHDDLCPGAPCPAWCVRTEAQHGLPDERGETRRIHFGPTTPIGGGWTARLELFDIAHPDGTVTVARPPTVRIKHTDGRFDRMPFPTRREEWS